MIRDKNIQIFLLALAAAWLLASTQIQRPENWSLAGLYLYWSVRILLEAGLFVAFLELFARLPGLRDRFRLNAVVAALVSLVPFALAVTALDLILGLPELGELVGSGASVEAGNSVTGRTHIGSFLLELVYLSDNHLVLCFLLSIPFLQLSGSTPAASTEGAASNQALPFEMDKRDLRIAASPADDNRIHSVRPGEMGFQRHLDTPLDAPVLRVEAQEHYVRLVTVSETRMVLYRFNDIVSELPGEDGMQVHRSHWVTFQAMARIIREDGRTWLELTEGTKVPVSRKYAEKVRKKISQLSPDTKKAVN